jgi:Holliday junction DNA helicase RuvA
MIGLVRGTLLRQEADRVLVETPAGVGYELLVAARTLVEMPPPGSAVLLVVHTQVREDAITLYGFLDERDRRAFRVLQGVNGIGPKLALAVVGTTSPKDLADAIARGDEARLARVPGLGKKTAARICLELKEKVALLAAPAVGILGVTGPAGEAATVAAAAAAPESSPEDDAAQALAVLGYGSKEIARAMEKAGRQAGDTVQTLLRRALRVLSPA